MHDQLGACVHQQVGTGNGHMGNRPDRRTGNHLRSHPIYDAQVQVIKLNKIVGTTKEVVPIFMRAGGVRGRPRG